MATLHIVNHPMALEECLAVASKEDAVLLIEEGVKARSSPGHRRLFVLEEDLSGGELSTDDRNITCIDYAGFVSLAATHQPIVSWSNPDSAANASVHPD